MSKLVLHSDQIDTNTLIDQASMEMFFNNKKIKLAYIPSQTDNQRTFYYQKVRWYQQFGNIELLYFDVDHEFNQKNNTELMSCDGIFLSGGNTYYFLNSLKKRNFIPVLQRYVNEGGVLIGVSAGSILMSNTISVTSIDDDIGGDQNTIGLKDFSALGLIDFEFFPHFDINDLVITERLLNYSMKNNSVIYACKDGDGIIVDDKTTHYYGEIYKFEKGVLTIL